MGAFWHPFGDTTSLAAPLVIDRGEGVYVWDEQGNRYLDAIAALWFANVGYGRQEIVDAVAAQMAKLPTYHAFGDLANRPALDLTERIAGLAPVADSKVFLTSGGSDAVDTAAKLARRFWQRRGERDRTVMITRERAYHGMHAYGTSIAGLDANRDGYGTMIGDVVTVQWDSVGDLADAIGSAGSERVAGFFCEPVIGAGGVMVPPLGYLKQAREVCRDAGVLFIADEVITGFGRTGDWFASSRFGLEPDLVLFAKGVTSGYLPLGGVIVAPSVADTFWGTDGEMFRHGYTYSGHAAACAAALANIDIIDREGLLEHAMALEVQIEEALTSLVEHPLVRDVRAGVGALAAVQLDETAVDGDPALPGRVIGAARRAGVLSRVVGGSALQVSPPLIITADQLAELAAGLREALDGV